jgi:hypothetical protein
MSEFQLKTAVAFIIFNRPGSTEKVFREIAKARPPKLLVVSDGPRSNRPDEAEIVAKTREIIKNINWECEVITDFSETNLGCKKRVSSGIDWVFEQVEECIILEDDCIPHPSFFQYCEELLEKYRNDDRIMAISGDNFQFGKKRTDHSYYFSRYVHIWGWATWRRAWEKYDVTMSKWPEIKAGNWLQDIISDPPIEQVWRKIFENVYKGNIDTWDYQWTFACWINSGLTILPQVNLISNIGFDDQATHTTTQSIFSEMEVEEMKFPLQAPPFMVRNSEADLFTDQTMFYRPLWKRIASRIRSFMAF